MNIKKYFTSGKAKKFIVKLDVYIPDFQNFQLMNILKMLTYL